MSVTERKLRRARVEAGLLSFLLGLGVFAFLCAVSFGVLTSFVSAALLGAGLYPHFFGKRRPKVRVERN